MIREHERKILEAHIAELTTHANNGRVDLIEHRLPRVWNYAHEHGIALPEQTFTTIRTTAYHNGIKAALSRAQKNARQGFPEIVYRELQRARGYAQYCGITLSSSVLATLEHMAYDNGIETYLRWAERYAADNNAVATNKMLAKALTYATKTGVNIDERTKELDQWCSTQLKKKTSTWSPRNL